MPLYTIAKGVSHGVLTGGNLSLLAASLGTPYEIETKDKILFIEDIGETPYRIDRMLLMLSRRGSCAPARVFCWVRSRIVQHLTRRRA